MRVILITEEYYICICGHDINYHDILDNGACHLMDCRCAGFKSAICLDFVFIGEERFLMLKSPVMTIEPRQLPDNGLIEKKQPVFKPKAEKPLILVSALYFMVFFVITYIYLCFLLVLMKSLAIL